MATSVTDFYKANPNYVGNANVPQQSQQPQAPKSKRGSGNQSWLSSIISELSGAGGAAAGAATGAALGSVVPGIGNIIGGIAGGVIGGFGGGTAGRLAENKVRDKEYRLGDALKEGAVSGAFGGIGPAWQGARGLSALGKASGSKGIGAGLNALSGMSDDAAKIAGKAISMSGKKAGRAIGQGVLEKGDLAYASRKGLQSTGDKLRGWNRGVAAGANGVSPDSAAAYNRALDGANKWFSGIGKSSQYTNVDDALKALRNSYKASPEAAQAFGKSNADDLASRFLQNLDDNPALKGTLKGKSDKIAGNLLDDAFSFSNKKNGDFIEYMSSKINPRYKTVSSGGSAGSVESQILEAFRDAGKSIIDENLMTRSGVNKQFANLLGGSKQVGKALTRDIGSGSGQGVTYGRTLANILGPGADLGGRVLQQVGGVTKYTTPAARGVIMRGITNQSMQPVVQDPTQEQDQSQVQNTYGQAGGQDISGMGDPMQQTEGQQMPQQSAYSLQQALADLKAHPDAKSRKNIMDYYDFVQSGEAAQAKAMGGNLTAQEKKTQQQTQTALKGLEQLQGLYGGAGGGQGRVEGIFNTISGKGGANSKANAYNQIRRSLTTALARALGETGIMTDQDREVYLEALPRLEDNPEEAAIKIQYLKEMLADNASYQETPQYQQQGGQ